VIQKPKKLKAKLDVLDPRIAYVTELPKCDFCGNVAIFDARTKLNNAWAYMCKSHFQTYGIRLGLGWGQRLVKQ
jgi:hypothetical protein